MPKDENSLRTLPIAEVVRLLERASEEDTSGSNGFRGRVKRWLTNTLAEFERGAGSPGDNKTPGQG